MNPILLKESYVKNVLGFSDLEINSKKISIYNDILEEHIRYKSFLNEGLYYSSLWKKEINFNQDEFINEGLKDWIDNGIVWVKDNAEEALKNVKDLAYDGVDAIKDFGKNSKAIIIAITAIIQDEDELNAYKENIYNNIKSWPSSVLTHLGGINDWIIDKNKKISDIISKIGKTLEEMWKGVKKMTGWISSLSMIVFGLCVRYIEDNFNIKKSVENANEYFNNPIEAANDFIESSKSVAKNNLELFINYFKGGLNDKDKSNLSNIIDNDDFQKDFYKFLIDKLEFLEKIKEKFIDMSKNIAGSALKNIAGPIEWLKYINEFFENTSWVTRVIAELLTTNGIK
jgi:hypothetical protein